jgi:uncharacterized membrane protein
MIHNNFKYKELLTFGWEKTKQHYWFLLGLALVCLVLNGATASLPIIGSVVSWLVTLAVLSVSFVIVDGHTPKWKDLLKPFETYKVVLNSFLATLLTMVIVFVGFILLILPGIYLATRLKFYLYFILEDENLGPVDALKKSMDVTKGIFWKLFWWNILLALINIGGLLLLGVGLLVTLPVTILAYTHLYRKLSAHTPHEHHEAAHIS